eukprot:6195870-Pleurochrysis_carterae.AAC.1
MANLLAAQAWRCPCVDRDNCLSDDRIKILDLYEFRKLFQFTAPRRGGKRDLMRSKLEAHYSHEEKSFSRSFVVAGRNDVCAAAFGLACGLSVSTFTVSRADCTLNRPLHNGRVSKRDQLQSEQRTHLECYICELRSGMEGDKGGKSGRWHTGKRAVSIRWNDYVRWRHSRVLPVIGSFELFKRIWSEHKEIKEHTAKSHSVCDQCGAWAARKDRLENRTDAAAIAERTAIEEAE